MAKFRISCEGDDQDELKTALTEALTMLGGEPAEEVTEETGEEAGDDLLGGGDEEPDPMEALREKITEYVVKNSKKAGGPDKIRAAFKKCGGNRLQDVKDAKLPALAKIFGVKA